MIKKQKKYLNSQGDDRMNKTRGWYSKRAKTLFPLLLVLPTLLFLCTFCIYPMIRGFMYSVTSYDRGNPKVIECVGLANFVEDFCFNPKPIFARKRSCSYILFCTLGRLWRFDHDALDFDLQ